MPNKPRQLNDPAVAALIRAAEAGTAEAAQGLGDRYREGDGVKQSDALALHWYTVGANLGDAGAQNNLGSMLLNGIGCNVDEQAAVAWYRASAEQGHAVAQFNLGLRYLHGSGVEPDDRIAGEWIAKSAAQGYLDAVGELGTLFRFGRGIEPDLLQAAQLHIAAARDGDATSHGNLASYQPELIALALEGNREAAFDLCLMYDGGLGGKKNPALCWAWIRWAHDGCPPLAEEDTRTVDLDEEVAKAFSFFQKVLEADVKQHGESQHNDLLVERDRSAAQPKPTPGPEETRE